MSAQPCDPPPTNGAETYRPIDLRVYLVTDAVQCEPLGITATVEAAVRGGVTAVQLRDSSVPDADFIRVGQELNAALKGSGVPLIIDDRDQFSLRPHSQHRFQPEILRRPIELTIAQAGSRAGGPRFGNVVRPRRLSEGDLEHTDPMLSLARTFAATGDARTTRARRRG